VTLNTLAQGAWALLLNRQSGAADLVFGAAFAGRPVELRGADTIVGPFVNNVPIRVSVQYDWSTEEFLRRLHARILELSAFQYTPLLEIQDCSEVPWRFRLFDSLVVFQNYLIDDAARRFGGKIEISDFTGPIHTNYPLLLLVEPGTAIKLVLIYDRQRIGRSTAEGWGHDLSILMKRMPDFLDRALGELLENLSPPAEAWTRSRNGIRVESQNYVPPQTDTEKAIAVVWQKMFGLDRVSVDDNLFDLGGHSLLLVQMHARLRTVLKREFPLVTLFTHPSVRSLARYCEQGTGPTSENAAQWRTRAQQQKEALTQLRNKRGNR